MKIKKFEFNPLGVNTYVLSAENNECVIIDPSCLFHDEKIELLNYIYDNDLIVKHLLNTHCHFDHIFGNPVVASTFHVAPEAHKEDENLIKTFDDQLKMFGMPASTEKQPMIGNYLNENDVISFGNEKLIVLHVPGHSAGSVVFYHKESETLFVGDVLFHGGIGRTDLPGGNFETLINGIKTKLLTMPNETVVYSGHGISTTIGLEKKNNPYL